MKNISKSVIVLLVLSASVLCASTVQCICSKNIVKNNDTSASSDTNVTYHKTSKVHKIQVPSLNNCKGCHGSHFQDRALGVSHIVKNMKSEDIEKALIGYKNGTYHKPDAGMSGIMTTQVKNYSNAQLKLIAKKIISTFN